jgi:hypothetical protein
MKSPVYEQVQARNVNVIQLEPPGVPFWSDSSWASVDELLGDNSPHSDGLFSFTVPE